MPSSISSAPPAGFPAKPPAEAESPGWDESWRAEMRGHENKYRLVLAADMILLAVELSKKE